ncbi:MAG: hypothetical protein H7138_19275, partial [Myxococcales bacterium]|nr:hypothetical protein [Myxococcales bacterium]
QQRRGRDLHGHVSGSERAGLEAEADRAGWAFARGKPFAVQGRAPAHVPLFKGAAPAKAPANNTTTIDLKSGGRIERKPPTTKTAAVGNRSAPTASGSDKPKAKEQVIIRYGAVQTAGAFAIERDANGDAKKLVGAGKLSLPTSKYMRQLDLDLSLGADGVVTAKLRGTAQSTIKIGGLTIQSGTLTAGIDHGRLTYALDNATLVLPRHIGQGALTIQGNGDQEPAFDASLAIKVPKLQSTTMSFHADATGYRAQGSAGVDFKQASGSVTLGLEKVGEDKALWSAAGSVGYTSERLSGRVGVQYNADGELSGEGSLAFQIADFLTGQATVAVDKEGHVAVNGEIRPPNETQLFPEKKVENTFFKQSLEFPIWGISIPAVGSVGLIAFIEGSLGYRVGVGAGVMRDIVLSGNYSTDPSKEPTFAITGEIFIPAFAELLISVGGGIKLSAFLAEVSGGVKVDGRAGFYGGLSVRPTLAYEGGKYRLTGEALLAGDVGLSAQVDAFVRLHVGKWMFSWEKEWNWKLAEWNKWLGLNLGMQADLDYTLGQPLSPDIFKLKKPDSIDVQDIAKSAMPQGGMPPQGAKGAQNQKAEFKPKGGAGKAAPAAAAKPKTAGTPAGAAGHKNQDPKGKNVKPAKPPKSGPPKKAKGKGPGQTGPNPKSKAKPNEQKLDAKPIIESFSMHGEPHRLIVQLGPGGHVDMASKRERLSVKVGHAVGKLIAKKASPQQISDLKAIGEVAKKGDKMASTAKMPDKPGTAKAAQQIAAYGNKWKVKDLDEVAVKAPRALVVPKPAHLDKLAEPLVKSLFAAKTGQVLTIKPGDPKELVSQVLENHKDARFDFDNAALTLPSVQVPPLMAAPNVERVGQLLTQQTGVAKVTLKKTEDKGQIKFEFIGEIGAAATIGSGEAFHLVDGPLQERPLEMHGHGHTLFVSVHGGTLLVELASRRAVLFTLVSSAIAEEKKSANRGSLLNVLGQIQAHLKELMEFEKAGGYSKMPIEEIRRATERVALVLVQIGQEFKIEDLEHLGHPSKFVEDNMLKEEFRSAARQKFYGANYRDDTEDWRTKRLNTLIHPTDKTLFKDELEGTWEPRDRNGKKDSNVTIDHIRKVYDHWNTEGSNSTQNDRLNFYNHTSDLRLTAWNNNSADGAKAAAEGARYKPNVGPNFRGPGEKE